MTRACTKCGETKPLETGFFRNSSGRGGYRSWCKACHTSSTHANRAANPEREKAYRRARAEKFAERLLVLKAGKPCADCGGTFHPVSMDFDHVHGPKVCDVSRMVNYPWASVLAEVAKCELVCSNCHRVRTWRRLRLARSSGPSPAGTPACSPPGTSP